MAEPESTPTVSSPAPKPHRGFFSFLFKSALGCTAFAVGAIVVFVLLLPSVASRTFVKPAAENTFNEICKGSLKLDAVQLAWFSPQSITNAIVSDPEGRPVAKISATLPSILRLMSWKSGRLDKVRVELEGDLVADDQGVTNLQRALELREPASGAGPESTPAQGSTDYSKFFENLDVEVTLDVRRVSWSDADTRRLGSPFEVQGFVATLTAKPGEPYRLKGAGQLVSQPPGKLSMDATVRGPIAFGRAWPVGSVDADVRIESFSTAMVDGLADLHGDLKELLGPSFDVTIRAVGATPAAGDLELALNSPRTNVKVKGRFADNAFVSAGEPALVANIAAPQAVLARRLAPLLPPGMRILTDEKDACSLKIENLVLPIPTGPLVDEKQVRAALEPLRCEFAADLPALRIDDEAMRAKGTAIGVDAKLTATVAPGAPLVFTLDGDLSGSPGATQSSGAQGQSQLALRATVPEPWSAVTGGELAPSQIDARVDNLAVAWIQAFLPPDLAIGEALGDKLDVSVAANGVSKDSGNVKVTLRAPRAEVTFAGRFENGQFTSGGDEGLTLHFNPPSTWTERTLASHLPSDQHVKIDAGPLDLRVSDLVIPVAAKSPTPSDPLAAYAGHVTFATTCTLPTVRWSDDAKHAAVLSGFSIRAKLAQSNALDLTLRSTLDTGSKGEVSFDVRVPDGWALLRMKSVQKLPPIDVALKVDRLPTSLVDAFAGTNGMLGTWLGPQISAGADVQHANLSEGHVDVRIDTDKVKASFAGKLEGGVFKAAGDEGLHVSARVARADWDREIAPKLPPDAKFDGALFEQPIQLDVRNVSVAIPDFASAQMPPPGAMLASLSAEASLSIPDFAWSNESLRAAKQTLGLAKMQLSAKVAPKSPLEARLSADVAARSGGKLEATFTQREPWSAASGANAAMPPSGVANAAMPPSGGAIAAMPPDTMATAAMPPFDVHIALQHLPTDMIEMFAGSLPMVTALLGPQIDLEVDADGVAGERGSVRAKLTTQTTSLAIAGRLEPGAFVCSGDEGLDLSVNVPAGYVESQLSSKLPAGTRIALAQDSGPLTAKIRNTKISFASSPKGEVAVRDASAKLSRTDSNVVAAIAPDALAKEDDSAATDSPNASADQNAAAEPSAALAILAGLGLKLDVALPTLTYADAATDAAGRPVVLRETRLKAELAPGAPPSMALTSKIDDAEPGSIDLTVRALDSLSKLAEPGELQRVRVALDLNATHVPTAIIDVLARQDGLLVDTLGPKLELKAKTDALSLEQGSFVVDLTSPQATLHASGQMKDGAIAMTRTDRGVARFALTPLASERVVGNLMPMMFNVSKPEGSDPVVLTIDDLKFPIDGDVSKLDATVNLNLGEVSYRLLPSLESMIGSLAGTKSVKVPQLVIPIRQGVATYQDMPIAIGGQTCKFSGTFNLVDKTFKMSTAIPLSVLGKKINGALDSARAYLDPNLPVPIEISGSWKKPKVAVGDQFMKTVVENAAKGGLQDLLKGLGGKKKKD